MKILVLTNLYPPHHIGGYELICQTVVETLRDRGHSISILTSDHGIEPAREHADPSAVERVLRINGLYNHPWRGLRELWEVEQHNNNVLRRAIRKTQPDLVYVWNMGGLSKSMLFNLQNSGVPAVFYVSDHWIARGLNTDIWLRFWNRTDAPLLHRLLRTAFELTGIRRRRNARVPTNPPSQARFPRIYFCSAALRELTAAAGFDVNHGAVIYCPVHLRYFQGEMKPLRSRVERLLYVGRLSQDKGVLTALRALKLLQGKLDLQFSIYGRGDPDYEAELRTYARENQLDVIWAAADLDQMPGVYRSHDLLVFTSEWAEPFALTPIEAMACGLPVVGTTTGGSAELFRSGENALVYPAGDAALLAERICQFANDHALRTRCAHTGYCEARQRYAAPVVVDQIEAYLDETIRTWRPMALPAYVDCGSQPADSLLCAF